MNGDEQQWRAQLFSKLAEAECEEEESRRFLTQAFEGGTKAVFLRDLRLDEILPWYARLETYMDRLLDASEQRLNSRHRP